MAMIGEKTTISALRRIVGDDPSKAREVLDEFLTRAENRSDLNAFVTPPREDREFPDEVGPLWGVPIAVKDNLCTRDYATTAGSPILEDYRPFFDATTVARLRNAGASIFGKTNLDEFAMGGSTETSAHGPTLHPLNPDRVPGGSSGGSAAAVAAGICPAALGSDTGGSVRQPASFCGIVGFKPSWGRVSRHGLIAFASSLDQVGWFTHDVDDAATLFFILAGPDDRDATCLDELPPPVDRRHCPPKPVDQLRIAVPRRWPEGCDVHDDIADGFQGSLRQLIRRGAEVLDVDFESLSFALPAYQVIATAEASSNLARYDGLRYGRRAGADTVDRAIRKSRSQGLGREVRRRLLLGTHTLSEGHYEAYYDRSCRVRRLIIDEFRQTFAHVDVVATPTTPTTAFPLGQSIGPLDAYSADIFTIPANLAGLPAISIPCGTDRRDMPFGIQLMAPSFGEPQLFSAARAVESVLGGPP